MHLGKAGKKEGFVDVEPTVLPQDFTYYGSNYDPLDPRGFYTNAVAQHIAESAGLERLAYKIFGDDVVASLALRLNPFSKHLVATTRITPVNRVRTFTAMGTPWARKRRHKEIQIIGRQPPATLTPDPFDREAYSESVTVPYDTTATLASQLLVTGRIEDTTRRTRTVGSDQGEFELWKPRIRSPAASRNRVYLEHSVYTTAGGYTYRSRDAEFKSDWTIGPAARMTQASMETLRTTERTILLDAMGDNAIKLQSLCMPSRKEFSFARSIAELKDLPLSLKGTVETVVQARDKLLYRSKSTRNFRRAASSEYVNFMFGWLPIYRDVVSLLDMPTRVARKVNYLMSRQGKDSTFRAGFDYGTSPLSSPPAFTYDLLNEETLVSLAHHATRNIKLRAVVNANVRFPTIEVPRLRRELTLRLWGLDPDPEDVYNLVPWSWLVDWFSGLGDYVEAFNLVNSDPSIINWGFLTGISSITSDSIHVSKATRTAKKSFTPPVPATVYTETFVENRTHTSRVEAKLQIRRSFGSAYNVRPTWDLGLFSGSQLAILGALLSMRT